MEAIEYVVGGKSPTLFVRSTSRPFGAVLTAD
jgi:hypothetical protein